MASGDTFPVKVKTWVTLNKVCVTVHFYTNRFFILVSEVNAGSAGTIVDFQRDISTDVALPPSTAVHCEDAPEIVYDIRVLFGVEKPEILLAARVIGSRIHNLCACDQPILFGFGLKRFEKPLIEEVAKSIVEEINRQ